MRDNASRMMLGFALPCVVILLCSSPSLASLDTLPAFLWGSGDYIKHDQHQSELQALYQIVSKEVMTADLFGDKSLSEEGVVLNNTALDPFRDTLVTVFVLGQLRRSDLAEQKGNGIAASLDKAVKAASSPVFLSDVQITHNELLETVKSQQHLVLELGDCTKQKQSVALESLQSTLEETSGPVSVILCNSEAPNLFTALEEELLASKRPYVIVYAGQPEVRTRPQARSLISTSPSNQKNLCDRKCQIQVRLFEVIILLILLLVALGIGLCMLNILDTPTRFEQQKKETSRHHE